LEAGSVWINIYRAEHWPLGGFHQPGLGRENVLDALRESTPIQTQIIDYGTPVADIYAM
jgi:acyl-CoA reductase-like NAD-dependent aldehyde dehydrogenase